ncbi:hypothetical protein Ciccas_012741 [Cichlidogyrus casuarinus]|uniref:Uncharacterized protein n=1 Tax=Cichlidogyrus casuarinus TaxID=1844966 RepID=A0ABD2PN77_9PLAT
MYALASDGFQPPVPQSGMDDGVAGSSSSFNSLASIGVYSMGMSENAVNVWYSAVAPKYSRMIDWLDGNSLLRCSTWPRSYAVAKKQEDYFTFSLRMEVTNRMNHDECLICWAWL